MAVYGFASEDDFRRNRRAILRSEGDERRRDTKRARWQGGVANAVIGCAAEDWEAFGTMDVQLRDADGQVDETIECRAPGTDGTDLTGTIGICVPITGFAVGFQFIPLECEPTGTII